MRCIIILSGLRAVYTLELKKPSLRRGFGPAERRFPALFPVSADAAACRAGMSSCRKIFPFAFPGIFLYYIERTGPACPAAAGYDPDVVFCDVPGQGGFRTTDRSAPAARPEGAPLSGRAAPTVMNVYPCCRSADSTLSAIVPAGARRLLLSADNVCVMPLCGRWCFWEYRCCCNDK